LVAINGNNAMINFYPPTLCINLNIAFSAALGHMIQAELQLPLFAFAPEPQQLCHAVQLSGSSYRPSERDLAWLA
jgi:hypothetical protein